MFGTNPLFRKEAIFIFASAPALTGHFFSIYDICIIIIFTYNLFFRQIKVSKYSLLLSIMFSIIVLSSTIAALGKIDTQSPFQWLFFIAIIFFTWNVISHPNWSLDHCFSYLALGILPNFMVAILQQTLPELDIFNSPELKSNPIPDSELIRASGLLYNPNSLAAYGLLCLCYYVFSKRIIFSIIALLSVLATFSKMIVLAPLIIFFKLIFSARNAFSFLALFLFLLIILTATFDFFYEIFRHRIENANSLGSRLEIIAHISTNFHDLKSILIGLGPNLDVSPFDQQRVHNKILSIYFQFGAIGVSAVLFLLTSFLFIYFNHRIDHREKSFAAFFVIVWFSTAMISTFTFFTFEYLAITLIALSGRRQERLLRSPAVDPSGYQLSKNRVTP